MRRWAMAAWAGWRRASWKAWRRWPFPPSATASAYDNGLFRQTIVDGWQQERPENWLASGNPWEFQRPELSYTIGFGGSVTASIEGGQMTYGWHPSEIVVAVAFDTPVVGYGNTHANTLRLWSAGAADPLQLDAFNRGDHEGAFAGPDAGGVDLSRALSGR